MDSITTTAVEVNTIKGLRATRSFAIINSPLRERRNCHLVADSIDRRSNQIQDRPRIETDPQQTHHHRRHSRPLLPPGVFEVPLVIIRTEEDSLDQPQT